MYRPRPFTNPGPESVQQNAAFAIDLEKEVGQEEAQQAQDCGDLE